MSPKLFRGWLWLILAGTLGLTGCAGSPGASLVNGGRADLEAVPFARGELVRLDGAWHFWSGELLAPSDVRSRLEAGPAPLFSLPGSWSRLALLQNPDALIPTGTLALNLRLPPGLHRWALRVPNANSALRLFVNDESVVEIGQVSSNAAGHVPSNQLRIARFLHSEGEVLLTLQVSNFNSPNTGTWDSLLLGAEQSILDKRHWDLVLGSLIAGALIFIGFYHLVIWALRREDQTPLWFGLICVLMSLRNLLMGERILVYLLPTEPWAWELIARLIHLSAHLSVPLFYLYFRGLFRDYFPRAGIYVTGAVALVWAAVEIFTPVMLHHRLLFLYEIFLLAAAFYALVRIVLALRCEEPGAALTLGGFGVVLVTALNDIFLSAGWIQSFYMASIGVFLYTFSQSYLLSWRSAQLYKMVASYTEHLQKLNLSLERFIPHEVLQFLEKRTILDVELGDYSERTMTVFFLDIRDFTSLSESISPQDNFRFINAFLRRVGPLIREHGGFVDKYLGDGFMALFPEAPDQAVLAALDIRQRLAEFNAARTAKGRGAIRVGIGIHTGPLMLGTIGENRRMDSTVISDTVNITSRLEQLTQDLKADVLVSAQTVAGLKDPARLALSPAGEHLVKGRSGRLSVYRLEGRSEEPSGPLDNQTLTVLGG